MTLPPPLDLIGFGPNGWGALLLTATGITVALSAAGFALGLVLGGVLVIARLSELRALRWFSTAYTTIVRSVPELLILYLLFFGASGFLSALSGLFLGKGFVSAPAFLTGVVALGMISASFISEILRGAWRGVDPGQREAAAALGLGLFVTLRKIMLPQVLRLALPGLGNIWQVTLKESALVSLTGLTELMRQAVIASNATAKPFYIYITAAVLYLAITTVSSFLFRKAERESQRGFMSR